MLYSQTFIDELRNRADIVRTIEKHVTLKKKGANWMACCPFHEEKTPSFSVNVAKGLFKCFGCGKGGNIFTFLMEYEGLNFPEAVKQLAAEVGMPLPEPIDDDTYKNNKKERERKNRLAKSVIDLNKIALSNWIDHLNEDNIESNAARKYLEERGLNEAARKKFQIGFAPDSWNTILNLLRAQNVDEDLIRQSGLVSVNEEKGTVYDRFRGRIIFPVLNLDGNPIAFGARTLGAGEPKYLNSPETPAYIKGKNLYGLFYAKDEIRRAKFVILVEGYMDYLALYQNGIQNVVASLGTAFTAEQSKLLGRFARKVVVNYDGDSAGIKAAQRAIETLLQQDFDIKVLTLPDGEDPDDFIKSNGAERYNSLRGNANPYLKFILEQSVKERNLGLPKHKTEAIEMVLPYLSAIKNPIQKRESFDQAMDFLRVEDRELKLDLWKEVKAGKRLQREELNRNVIRATRAKPTVAEQNLLDYLLLDEQVAMRVIPLIEPTDYKFLHTADIFAAVVELFDAGEQIERKSVLEKLNGNEVLTDMVQVIYLSESLRGEGEDIEPFISKAEDCFVALRDMAISRRMTEIGHEVALAEQNSDSGALSRLVAEQLELARLRRELMLPAETA
ncbi:MAG: DNA primase [Pyrinomonadaceae bacterium]